MKTESEIVKQIANLETELKEAKRDRRESYARITGLKAESFSIINETFISITCESLEEVAKALNNVKPFVNGWKITDGAHITSLYKITIVNDYHSRSLRISFTNASGINYWVNIEFNNLPDWFKDSFFVETKRNLYSTEAHYVNIPAHYKKFRDIRIQAYSFPSNGQQVSFYGGDKVCKDENLISEMIEDIKLLK